VLVELAKAVLIDRAAEAASTGPAAAAASVMSIARLRTDREVTFRASAFKTSNAAALVAEISVVIALGVAAVIDSAAAALAAVTASVAAVDLAAAALADSAAAAALADAGVAGDDDDINALNLVLYFFKK